jgi:hypothetical protein
MRLPGESVEELNRPETAWRLLAPWQISPRNATLARHTVYTFRARWADAWRHERFLLAGDAAHLMPPFAGQGMGAGLRDAINLSWKLDLVLSEQAPASLLDSYTSERLPNVYTFINVSVELGKIICVTDPEVAAARDAQMLAMRESPEQVSPSLPSPPLGPGIFRDDDPLAGQFFIQGNVTHQGRTGRFDDIVGRGFCLLSRLDDPARALSEETRARFSAIGGLCAAIAPSEGATSGQVIDINATYHAWFAANNCALVLTRPDFFIFASSPNPQDAESLVQALLDCLH